MDPRTLAPFITRARSAGDLASLFGALGYRPEDAAAEDGWTAVARWRSYRVLARVTRSPRDLSRQMARRLAGEARPALAAALGPDELAIAAPRIGSAGAAFDMFTVDPHPEVPPMRLTRVLPAALLAVALAASPAAPQDAATTAVPEIGAMAPDFELPGATRHGVLRDPVRLSDYRGKVVVVAFFFRVRTRG